MITSCHQVSGSSPVCWEQLHWCINPADEAAFDIYPTKTHRVPPNKHVRSRSVAIYYQMKVPNTRLE